MLMGPRKELLVPCQPTVPGCFVRVSSSLFWPVRHSKAVSLSSKVYRTSSPFVWNNDGQCILVPRSSGSQTYTFCQWVGSYFGHLLMGRTRRSNQVAGPLTSSFEPMIWCPIAELTKLDATGGNSCYSCFSCCAPHDEAYST
jgi:hypothetical protein